MNGGTREIFYKKKKSTNGTITIGAVEIIHKEVPFEYEPLHPYSKQRKLH